MCEKEFPKREIPRILRLFVALNLIKIHWVGDNTRAYKKLIPALESYPNSVIITIDDDQIYDRRTISTLLETHRAHPSAVCSHLMYGEEMLQNALTCYRSDSSLGMQCEGFAELREARTTSSLTSQNSAKTAHSHTANTRITKSTPSVESTFIESSSSQDSNASQSISTLPPAQTPRLSNIPVGVSAVLYPPHCFTDEIFNLPLAQAICPYSDDLWFFIMRVLAGRGAVLAKTPLGHPKTSAIALFESPNLFEINLIGGYNAVQLDALLKAYPAATRALIGTIESTAPMPPNAR